MYSFVLGIKNILVIMLVATHHLSNPEIRRYQQTSTIAHHNTQTHGWGCVRDGGRHLGAGVGGDLLPHSHDAGLSRDARQL